MGRFKSFDQFLDLFPAKPRQRIKGGYNVICPAHNDHTPSLTVRLEGGRILLNCRAGCDVDAITKALNIQKSDLFLDKPAKKIVATYPYPDANSKVLYEVVRYEPKAFAIRRPDGFGEYIWNLEGITPILYHLPDILKAKALGDTIYLTEGEKDCDRLWSIGLVATTNPMGAGKWRDSYTSALEEAKVVFIPHTDEEGQKHAKLVTEAIRDRVVNLKVVNLPTGKDVSDYLEIYSAEDLEKSVENTLPYSHEILIPNNLLNSYRGLSGREGKSRACSGQVSGQVVDKLRDYGELSEPFDSFLKENPEPHWKKDVAEVIGTTYKDQGFMKLVQRRFRDGMIRISHGGDKIQWVNKDWQRSKIPLDAGKREFLGLSLPFGAEKYIATPEHSQIVVAGDVGSGKTHYGYHLANLNVGKIQIRHFVNEIGDSKAIRNLDDFPRLVEFFGKGYDLVNQDKEQLDVAENIDSNGLNIYDYLHLSWTKEWFLLLQKELARLSQKLETGVIVVMLQKKRGIKLAMGGDSTRMQCETYISLNIEKDIRGSENEPGYKIGRVDIVKCKDWASCINPEVLSCRYRTAPKHGKLILYDGEGWFERNQE
jgi:hypothetical protein